MQEMQAARCRHIMHILLRMFFYKRWDQPELKSECPLLEQTRCVDSGVSNAVRFWTIRAPRIDHLIIRVSRYLLRVAPTCAFRYLKLKVTSSVSANFFNWRPKGPLELFNGGDSGPLSHSIGGPHPPGSLTRAPVSAKNSPLLGPKSWFLRDRGVF